MNQTLRPERPAPPPAAPKARPLTEVGGADREFLPAAIEILETPPSPRSVALMLTLCLFFVAAAAWSFFGKLDVHSVAQGKIVTAGYSKVIQPLDLGKVLRIAVQNGDRVHAGQLLVALDPAEAAADMTASRDAVSSQTAEIARRRTAIAVVAALGDDVVPVAPVIAFPEAVSRDARIREQAVLAADLAELGDSLVNLQKQVAQKAATRQRLNMSIAFQTDLIKTLQDRVSVRQEAIKLAVGTKINLFDALESLDKSRSSLASDRGQLIETEAAIVELDSRKRRLISQFIADNTTKLADAQKKRDESTQQLAKAEAKLAHTRLVSPIDGTVQQLAVTTIGQVVTPGQQLMAIVPSHAPLVVEAYVGNGDIGFIRVGQPAAVKIDAFPFTRYGSMAGTVTEIASEAMEESEARRRQANASAVISPSSASATPAGQPQAFVFPVTIALAAQAMDIDGIKRPLVPGMTVTTEIRTERRRVIDYLFSPLARTASEAMRER